MKVSVSLLSFLLLAVSSFAQPWITPGSRTNKIVGPVWITGYGLTVDGGITTGTGTVSAAYFVGDGSLLTGIAGGPGGLSSYDPGFFATNNSKIYKKAGASSTGDVFYGVITLPTGQKFDSITVSNLLSVSQDSTHALNLNFAAGVFTLVDPNISFTHTTYDPLTRRWEWNATNTFPFVGAGMLDASNRLVLDYVTASRMLASGSDKLVTNSGITIANGTNLTGVGSVTASAFVGDGSGLTGITGSGITNDVTTSGYVKTTVTPTVNTFSDSARSMQDWYTDQGFLAASIGYNAFDGTSRYGRLGLFGSASNAYGNLMGFEVWNTNLNNGSIASDRRAFVMRIKDPAGTNTANWTDKGAYTLFESRYSLSAPDRGNSPADLVYANFLLCDENGNVGLGDLGQRSDDPAQGMLHPWAKTTFYPSYLASSSTTKVPLIGLFPSQPVKTTVTNSLEFDGTNIFLTDNQNVRYKIPLMSTNGQLQAYDGGLLTGVSGGAGIATLQGKGTGTVLRVAVVGVSNGTPSKLVYADASTNLVTSTISILEGTNIYGLGDYTGRVVVARTVMANLNATNATVSRTAVIGADGIVTNGVSTTAEEAFLSGVKTAIQTQFTDGTNNVTGLRNAFVTESNSFLQISNAHRALSNATLVSLSGKGTQEVFFTSVFGVSNGTPSTIAIIDANTNVGSSTMSIANGSNITGIGTAVFGGAVTMPSQVVTGATPGVTYWAGTNGFKRVINASQQTLSYVGTAGAAQTNVNVDMSSGDCFFLLVTNNVFLSATNITVGQMANIHLVMGGAGSYALAFNTNWCRTNAESYTISTAVGSYSIVGLMAGPYGSNTLAAVKKGY